MPEPSSSSPIFQSQHDLGRTHETAASWLRERSKAATSKQSHFTKGLERRLRKPRETQASSLHDGSSELSQSTVLYVSSESPVTVRGCQHYVQRRQPEASEISTRPDATYETASSATLTEDSQYYSVREKRNESIKSVEEAVHLGRRGRHQQSEEGRDPFCSSLLNGGNLVMRMMAKCNPLRTTASERSRQSQRATCPLLDRPTV